MSAKVDKGHLGLDQQPGHRKYYKKRRRKKWILTSTLQVMGVVVLGYGIFALSDGKDLARLVEHGAQATGSDFSVALYDSASIVLIVASSLAVIVAFLGCCGAIKVG